MASRHLIERMVANQSKLLAFPALVDPFPPSSSPLPPPSLNTELVSEAVSCLLGEVFTQKEILSSMQRWHFCVGSQHGFSRYHHHGKLVRNFVSLIELNPTPNSSADQIADDDTMNDLQRSVQKESVWTSLPVAGSSIEDNRWIPLVSVSSKGTGKERTLEEVRDAVIGVIHSNHGFEGVMKFYQSRLT
eukprot:PhF_6_TR34659/c0_g1_i2/m.50430